MSWVCVQDQRDKADRLVCHHQSYVNVFYFFIAVKVSSLSSSMCGTHVRLTCFTGRSPLPF